MTVMDDVQLDIPAWYLAATARIRGYWRREVAVVFGAFGVGLLVGLLLR